MYLADNNADDDIFTFNLTTPYDISTAVLESDVNRFTLSREGGAPRGVEISPDGIYIYSINFQGLITQYELEEALMRHQLDTTTQEFSPKSEAIKCALILMEQRFSF